MEPSFLVPCFLTRVSTKMTLLVEGSKVLVLSWWVLTEKWVATQCLVGCHVPSTFLGERFLSFPLVQHFQLSASAAIYNMPPSTKCQFKVGLAGAMGTRKLHPYRHRLHFLCRDIPYLNLNDTPNVPPAHSSITHSGMYGLLGILGCITLLFAFFLYNSNCFHLMGKCRLIYIYIYIYSVILILFN